ANCCYPLRIGFNTIGRLPDNDIELEEITVSRRHCVLLVHAWGGCELHDTASRNGTFVNGHRLRQAVRLTSGDQIGVCNRPLLFVSEKEYHSPSNSSYTDTEGGWCDARERLHLSPGEG